MMNRARSLLMKALLGSTEVRQKFHMGLHSPQKEVDVWLEGGGYRIDVTHRHFMACGSPLIFGIGFAPNEVPSMAIQPRLRLRFRQHGGTQKLLGEIGLKTDTNFRVRNRRIYLFRPTYSRNYCMPWIRRQAHLLFYEYLRRQSKDDVQVTGRDSRAMTVFYLCPRPTALVTVGDLEQGNLFPMNLMGSLGDDCFAFGLNKHRAAPLVERAGSIVLSTVPREQQAVVASLGKNHRRTSIDWNELPFSVVLPRRIAAPVPSFALGACRMQVEESLDLGSHTLFIAKRLTEVSLADGLELFMAHAMYKAALPDRGKSQ
jgi:flavin reductase (DIM6/NTAB) family NADH-FMN oxidoreductase RutF